MTITLGSSCPIGLVASRFGISGVQRMPPQPKGQVNPDIYLPLFVRLEASHPALHEVLLTAIRNKVDGNPSVFWSDPLASAVAVSSSPLGHALHLDLRLKRIIEQAHAHECWRSALDDFLFLILVHEGCELSQRGEHDTLKPDLRVELTAVREEALVYLSLPPPGPQDAARPHAGL